MSCSPDSIPPGWEEAITSSPETLPPGFENPSSLSTPTSPLQEKPSNSLTSPTSPLPLENQVNLTHRPPSPSPTPPQESQSHQNSPLKLPQENRGPSLQTLSPPPHETPISLSPSFSPVQQGKLDAMPRPPLQLQDGQGPLPSSQLLQGNLGCLNPPPPQSLPEIGQMVCGSCNELLSYPRGSKYVQCACCQTTNFVLEAHQVGIVKCGKCSVLLMYPYTSKSLRCSSCHYVTEIGKRRNKGKEEKGFVIVFIISWLSSIALGFPYIAWSNEDIDSTTSVLYFVIVFPTTFGPRFLYCRGFLLHLKILCIRQSSLLPLFFCNCVLKERSCSI